MTRDLKMVETVFWDIISTNAETENMNWVKDKANSIAEGVFDGLNMAFAAMPRKTGKKIVSITQDQQKKLGDIIIGGWTIDRLTRVWLLMLPSPSNKTEYVKAIEQLFKAAEMNELVALYSALPYLQYPEEWKLRCAEGIRSNIGTVLESLMYNNPYPAAWLPDGAWNQLVLKAVFTGKDISRIIGIDKRANRELATILSDYAHERWSAQRPVDSQLWRCVGKFLDKDLFHDIERLVSSGTDLEREAAALACADSDYPAAKQLLDKQTSLKSEIISGTLSWDELAHKSMHVVS